MQVKLEGVTYLGEPVWRGWSHNKTMLTWLSREIKKLPDGSWKFVRWITLRELKVDRRYGTRRIMADIERTQNDVLRMPGICLSDRGAGISPRLTSNSLTRNWM